MTVFVNIIKNQFYISKFSSNIPQFFEMTPVEMKGMLLRDLMPKVISKEHDRYVFDYVN